jgi:hypothetical protein
MKLKFLARRGPDGVPRFVNVPGPLVQGQPMLRVGRSWSPATGPGSPSENRATKEPFEISSTDQAAPHLARQCQKGGLWAADKATAEFCGVEFVNVTQDADGEWIADDRPVKPAAEKASPKKES